MTSVLIIGASGLTGQALVTRLIADDSYQHIILLVRTPLKISDDKVHQQLINFNDIDLYQDLFKVNQVFCCLGTTIKAAGSKTAFKAIDVDLVSRCAAIACHANVETFMVISAIGANVKSHSFYSRCKGDMERNLRNLCQGATMKLIIFQPSLLLGKRKQLRRAETITTALTKYLSFVFIGPLKKYHPVSAVLLAKAMIVASQQVLPEQITTLRYPQFLRLHRQENR